MSIVAHFDGERALVVDGIELLHEQLNGGREAARIQHKSNLLERGSMWVEEEEERRARTRVEGKVEASARRDPHTDAQAHTWMRGKDRTSPRALLYGYWMSWLSSEKPSLKRFTTKATARLAGGPSTSIGSVIVAEEHEK